MEPVGITRIEKISSAPGVREPRCSNIGLLTVETRFVAALKQLITAGELKHDEVPRNLPELVLPEAQVLKDLFNQLWLVNKADGPYACSNHAPDAP